VVLAGDTVIPGVVPFGTGDDVFGELPAYH
jgi:hypothetical protein